MGGIPAFNPVTCSMRLFFESVAEKTPVEEGMLIDQGSGACSKCGPGNGFRASGDHSPRMREVNTCTRICAKFLFVFSIESIF